MLSTSASSEIHRKTLFFKTYIRESIQGLVGEGERDGARERATNKRKACTRPEVKLSEVARHAFPPSLCPGL